MPDNKSTFAYVYSGEVIASGIVLPAVGAICVALRFVARDGKNNKVGVDDWLCLPAVFFVIGMGICLDIGAFRKVMGYATPPSSSDDPDVQETGDPPGQKLLQKIEFPFTTFMILAYGFIKLSVIFFYRRIFALASNKFHRASQVAAVLSVMWTLAFVLVHIFGCGIHFDYNWGPLSLEHYCRSDLVYLEALMVSDFITDFMVLALPFPMIWRLRTSFKHKLTITGVFLLGAMSLAASTARMVLQIQLVKGGYATKTDIFCLFTCPALDGRAWLISRP